MSLLARYVFSLIFIAAALGLIPPPNPALNVPLSLTSSSLIHLNLSNTANDIHLDNTTNPNIWCDGKRYGYGLDKASCIDARKKISTGSLLFEFGARTVGQFERPTPYRYLSSKYTALFHPSNNSHPLLNLGNGLCAIDIITKPGFVYDTATNDNLSAAAALVLNDCVLRDPSKRQGHIPIGGTITGVGQWSYSAWENLFSFRLMISPTVLLHRDQRWTKPQGFCVQHGYGMQPWANVR